MGPSSSRTSFKNQEAKLDLKLQLAVKESAALKPEDLDKLRTERLQFWTLRALQLKEEQARWVTKAPPQLQRMLTSVHGPLVLIAHMTCIWPVTSNKGYHSLASCPGLQISARLEASRCATFNTYVMSKVVPSEWSLDLWESTVADAQAGYMTPPVPVHHLDLSLISLTRRLPVQEERPKGMKTRSVDHFTESGVNPTTRPQNALTHETVDHAISLLVLYMSVGVAPLMWKRDVAQAFRKVPIKHDATDLTEKSWVKRRGHFARNMTPCIHTAAIFIQAPKCTQTRGCCDMGEGKTHEEVAHEKLVTRLARLRNAATEAVLWEDHAKLVQVAKAFTCITPTKRDVALDTSWLTKWSGLKAAMLPCP